MGYEDKMATFEQVQLVVMGPAGVGKSALTVRLVTGDFVSDYDPTIEDSYTTNVEIKEGQHAGKNVLFDILDTAGQEEYGALQDQWIREGEGFVLVYSIDDKDSLTDALEIFRSIKRAKDADDELCVV